MRSVESGIHCWQEDKVAKEDRGFASMDRNKQRDIASKGGKAAHQKGRAHEWTSEEAREAGRRGGIASHRRKQEGGEMPIEASGLPSGNASGEHEGRTDGREDRY
jgi:general stress protein YciG